MTVLTVTHLPTPHGVAVRVRDDAGRSAQSFTTDAGLVGLAALGRYVLANAERLGLRIEHESRDEPFRSLNPAVPVMDTERLLAEHFNLTEDKYA